MFVPPGLVPRCPAHTPLTGIRVMLCRVRLDCSFRLVVDDPGSPYAAAVRDGHEELCAIGVFEAAGI